MTYNIQLLKEENYKATFWSGGMAKELTTFPLNSNYADVNFLWRLGIAKIDIEESTFSSLPKVSRKFMVTDGKITIHHEDRYEKLLMPFEQDEFMGDWNTKTYGKASVFNLMTRQNYNGELIHINIAPNKERRFEYTTPLNKILKAICFYTANGSFISTINDTPFETVKNNLLVVTPINFSCSHEFILSSNSSENTDIIVGIILVNS